MAEPSGLIFDLDGTLIHSAPQIHAAALHVLATEGLQPIDYAMLLSFIGNGIDSLVARVLHAQGLASEGERHKRMCAAFVTIYEQNFDLTTLYPGVPVLLSTLRTRGHRLAICTNKPEAPTRAILRHFNLAEFFPVIVGGDTLPHRKPDPAPLRLAMSHLATQSFWFIGDSEVDAETAKAAKVRLALFTGGYRNTAAQDLGAEVIFDNHTQLLDVLIQRLPDFG